MGTRADFYIGTGPKAEWLGSVGWDGYEWAQDKGCPLMRAKNADEFRAAVKKISELRDDWTSPDQGWPWPWDTSHTTDYTYSFGRKKTSVFIFGGPKNGWPDMKSIKNVSYGKNSGLIVIGG